MSSRRGVGGAKKVDQQRKTYLMSGCEEEFAQPLVLLVIPVGYSGIETRPNLSLIPAPTMDMMS